MTRLDLDWVCRLRLRRYWIRPDAGLNLYLAPLCNGGSKGWLECQPTTGVSSVVEQRSCKAKVVSSSLTDGTKIFALVIVQFSSLPSLVCTVLGFAEALFIRDVSSVG